ncbi:hypothetical protein NDU88_004607 [Pleurodeles waltl]|uniref:Uncharacterized protein n=1 Tax=Pleurodeles waltl TaxID=8319 RepID=A0AAV7MVY3_PLEWA|nr:hypothetical protein NDU88_004607 [Pleurodeles waltl]
MPHRCAVEGGTRDSAACSPLTPIRAQGLREATLPGTPLSLRQRFRTYGMALPLLTNAISLPGGLTEQQGTQQSTRRAEE